MEYHKLQVSRHRCASTYNIETEDYTVHVIYQTYEVLFTKCPIRRCQAVTHASMGLIATRGNPLSLTFNENVRSVQKRQYEFRSGYKQLQPAIIIVGRQN